MTHRQAADCNKPPAQQCKPPHSNGQGHPHQQPQGCPVGGGPAALPQWEQWAARVLAVGAEVPAAAGGQAGNAQLDRRLQRAHHSATALGGGRVLVLGGVYHGTREWVAWRGVAVFGLGGADWLHGCLGGWSSRHPPLPSEDS
jgi:hypothetical protein